MRVGHWAKTWGIVVIPAEEFGPVAPGEVVYRVKDVFTTRDGSWDVQNKPGTIEQWARDAYLLPLSHPQYNDDGGADHHIFGAIATGERLVPQMPFAFWTGDGQNNVEHQAKKSGWANLPIWSHFAPERGERGAWLWAPAGVRCDVIANAGLPDNQHVSWWGVWHEVTATAPIEPGPDEPTGKLAAAIAKMDVAWVELKAALRE